MARLFYHTMQDNAGNLLFDVTATVRFAGTGTMATIYGDEGLTVILPNPVTNHPSFGSFHFFLGAGDYDVYLAKGGYTFETLTGVQGHGTMAQQNADAVGITGGTITGLSSLSVNGICTATQHAVEDSPGDNLYGYFSGMNAAGGAGRYAINAVGTAPSYFAGPVGVGTNGPPTGARMTVHWLHASKNGIFLRAIDSDTGVFSAVGFFNVADDVIGSITTTAVNTAYNTASDARLKHDVDDLTGELALIQALRPVRFKWNADDSDGIGFLAHEVAQHVPGVVTGEQDAVEEDGRIRPQMIDYSKLVPVLTGAVKSLIERVEALQARVEVLEDALGVP